MTDASLSSPAPRRLSIPSQTRPGVPASAALSPAVPPAGALADTTAFSLAVPPTGALSDTPAFSLAGTAPTFTGHATARLCHDGVPADSAIPHGDTSSPGRHLPGAGRGSQALTVATAAGPVVPRRSRKARLLRVGALAAVVAGLGVAAATLPLDQIQDAARSLGWAAGLVMAGVGAMLLAVLVPRTAISLACGALLGPAIGFTAALGAAMIAATATYLAGRWAGHGLLAARVGGRLHRLDGWLSQRGFSAVLLVRLLPLAPFGLIGYAYGTTSVRRHHYLLGTLVAAIPSSFSYAILGAAVTTPGDFNPLTFVPAVCGIILTSTIVYRWRRTARRPTS